MSYYPHMKYENYGAISEEHDLGLLRWVSMFGTTRTRFG